MCVCGLSMFVVFFFRVELTRSVFDVLSKTPRSKDIAGLAANDKVLARWLNRFEVSRCIIILIMRGARHNKTFAFRFVSMSYDAKPVCHSRHSIKKPLPMPSHFMAQF